MATFTSENLKQIEKLGVSISTIEQQLNNFKTGFPYVNLVGPAIIGNGIFKLEPKELTACSEVFDNYSMFRNILKFVPASGAASRMFKDLFTYLEKCSEPESAEDSFFKDKGFNSPFNFIDNIEKFAFYKLLDESLQGKGTSILDCQSVKDFKTIIEELLTSNGLDYANLPKGLLHFHLYSGYARTSMEEHLVEGALYCRDNDSVVNIHFTVSPEHMNKFKEKFNEVKHIYQKRYGVKFEADFSIQKSATDTISADVNNQPFIDNNGSLVFRPGGHGALIENLNDLKSDIVFIKNIDNVVPDSLKEETVLYKKVIGGLLINIQKYISSILKEFDDSKLEIKRLREIANYAQKDLCISMKEFENIDDSEKQAYLFERLNRPIRICGMVKNQGEPGGGPFWIIDSKGEQSLQIIESSQIDMKNEQQLTIFKQSTHFNPVDLVCGVRDYKGKSFNLLNFVDPQTGFISIKSKDGKELKAQELPGLWNGAMANWITIFVEVPLITFNPVKTVNDLLREEHQSV